MTRFPYPVSASVKARSRLSRRHFWMILVSHLVLLVALALSLRWNVLQARDHSTQLAIAYTAGHTAGIKWAEAILILEAKKLQRELEEAGAPVADKDHL